MRTLGDDVPSYSALSGEEKAMVLKLAAWMCRGDNANRRRLHHGQPTRAGVCRSGHRAAGTAGQPERWREARVSDIMPTFDATPDGRPLYPRDERINIVSPVALNDPGRRPDQGPVRLGCHHLDAAGATPRSAGGEPADVP